MSLEATSTAVAFAERLSLPRSTWVPLRRWVESMYVAIVLRTSVAYLRNVFAQSDPQLLPVGKDEHVLTIDELALVP